jgi:hypothetical protein
MVFEARACSRGSRDEGRAAVSATDTPIDVVGSCLCGTIRYAASGLGAIGHCHCETCRKAHTAAFSSVARVARANFRWTQGEDALSWFESSPGKRRYFCSRCGSQLTAGWVHEDELILRLGSLDTDPQSQAVAHIWTSDKAPWYDIADGLPCVPEGRPRKVSPER